MAKSKLQEEAMRSNIEGQQQLLERSCEVARASVEASINAGRH